MCKADTTASNESVDAGLTPARKVEHVMCMTEELKRVISGIDTGHPWDARPLIDCLSDCDAILSRLGSVADRINGKHVYRTDEATLKEVWPPKF